MSSELTHFRDLILTLFERHAGYYENISGRLADTLESIPYAFTTITDRGILEGVLPSEGKPISDFKEVKSFLRLRPLDSGAVPLVSIKTDFNLSRPKIKIRLALFLIHDEIHIKSYGYRFESPEGYGGGVHDYYHSQPIRNVHRDINGFDLMVPEWHPDTEPAWPVDARNSVGLVLSMLFSLYGMHFKRELMGYPISMHLKQYIEENHWYKLPSANYWKVKHGGNDYFYATWYDRTQFDRFCRAKYPNDPRYKKELIDDAGYRSVPQGQRWVC